MEAVGARLALLPTNAMEKSALKAQFQFRKFVLQQSAPAHYFAMSRNRKDLAVDELTGNLAHLLTPADASVLAVTPRSPGTTEDAEEEEGAADRAFELPEEEAANCAVEPAAKGPLL